MVNLTECAGWSPHLPTTNSGDYENEREGDHCKGDQEADLQKVFTHWSLVIRIESRQGLVSKRISHLLTSEESFPSLASENEIMLT